MYPEYINVEVCTALRCLLSSGPWQLTVNLHGTYFLLMLMSRFTNVKDYISSPLPGSSLVLPLRVAHSPSPGVLTETPGFLQPRDLAMCLSALGNSQANQLQGTFRSSTLLHGDIVFSLHFLGCLPWRVTNTGSAPRSLTALQIRSNAGGKIGVTGPTLQSLLQGGGGRREREGGRRGEWRKRKRSRKREIDGEMREEERA